MQNLDNYNDSSTYKIFTYKGNDSNLKYGF